MTHEPGEFDETVARAVTGERRAVGSLLTIAERAGPGADRLAAALHSRTGHAHVVGVTGPPGSGKSTLVGRLTAAAAEVGTSPAVLAVDPSSPLTGGAILGDRVRIDVTGGGVFVRSIATRGHAGGLAVAVPGAIRVLDACGFDPVIIETVGVGQVEVDITTVADTTVVVATPGMGDAVQANKAGLLEVADIFVVNKADRPDADGVRLDLERMLDLSHLTGHEQRRGRRAPIIMTDSLRGTGIADLWSAMVAHREFLDHSGLRAGRQADRLQAEVRAIMAERLYQTIDSLLDSDIGRSILSDLEFGRLDPISAADRIISAAQDPSQS